MIKKLFQNWLCQFSYGPRLELYVMSRNPKSIYDVERLTQEFNLKLSRGEL